MASYPSSAENDIEGTLFQKSLRTVHINDLQEAWKKMLDRQVVAREVARGLERT